VRVLRPVVQVPAGPVPHVRQHLALRDAITLQPIGDEAPGLVLQASEQAFEEPLSTTLALSRRGEEVVGGSEGNDKEPEAERTAWR
jgi:hypothetical protein